VLEINKSDLDDLGNKINNITNGGDYNLKVIDDDINYQKIAGSTNKSRKNTGRRDQYMMDEKDLKKLNRKKKKKRFNQT